MAYRNRWVRALLLMLALIGVTGCSYISSLFPDKQKEYQYTTEIPALEIPPDLSRSTVAGSRWRSPDAPDGATETESPEESVTSPPPAEETDDNAGTATLAQNTEDVPLIEMNVPFADAWNNVGRALGRMRIEVSDQNRTDGTYYVYYGDSEEKPQDTSMWDDIAGLFSSDKGGAVEYRLKLEEHKTSKRVMTDVFLFDSEGQPVRDGPPLELLKQLQQELQKLPTSTRKAAVTPPDEVSAEPEP